MVIKACCDAQRLYALTYPNTVTFGFNAFVALLLASVRTTPPLRVDLTGTGIGRYRFRQPHPCMQRGYLRKKQSFGYKICFKFKF